MSENLTNREILEKIAREVMHIEDKKAIDDFVNMFVFTVLID